jgi:hypothetical protein
LEPEGLQREKIIPLEASYKHPLATHSHNFLQNVRGYAVRLIGNCWKKLLNGLTVKEKISSEY